MENIFNYSLIYELTNILEEAGFNQVEIDNIIKKRRKELAKPIIIARLNTLIDLLEQDNYKEIVKYLRYSPAGDGYGCDNYYISFENDFGMDYDDLGKICESILGEKDFKANLALKIKEQK